jgi:hypothetical protein
MMGYSSILWIYEDGIKSAEKSRESWDALRPLLGQAVLEVCTGKRVPRGELEAELDRLRERQRLLSKRNPEMHAKFEEQIKSLLALYNEEVRVANVGSHSNCVNLCSKVHSADAALFLWVANCLRPLQALDDERLAIVEELVREERTRRGNT